MGLEKRFMEQDAVLDKFVAPNEDYEMTVRDYVLRPSADGDSGAITITLPPVNAAAGRFYSIVARNADAANTITIQDRDDSECWPGDITMDGKCDRALLYSDGFCWFTGAETLTASGTTPSPITTTEPL